MVDFYRYNLFREWRVVVKMYLCEYIVGDDLVNCFFDGFDYSVSVFS